MIWCASGLGFCSVVCFDVSFRLTTAHPLPLCLRSYLLFLQQKPLEQLSELVSKHVDGQDLQAAVVVTSLPAKVMKEHVAALFARAGAMKHLFLYDGKLTYTAAAPRTSTHS